MTPTCRYCKKPINPKIRYCPHCGGENIPETPGEKAPLCPRCHCGLETSEYRGSVIDTCPGCAGLWLDTAEFHYHTSERDTFSDPDIPRLCPQRPLVPESGYLPCVRCGSLMAKTNFRKISGVLIDMCRAHGIWLDASELERIRCFIARGGLDKSQDKNILANRLEISKVAGEVRDLNTLFRTLNKWNLKRILLQGF